jgi:hypothetical protein
VRYLLGNIKKDGNLSFEDLLIIQKQVLYQDIFLTPEDYIIADINKDGSVNSLELLQINAFLISRGYTYIYDTINIERGDTIAESLPMPPTQSISKISDNFSLKENCAYGLRFTSKTMGKRVFGGYATNINIPALNNDYVGFFVGRFYNESYDSKDLYIYVYQDVDGIYMLQYFYNWLDEQYDFDITSAGYFTIEELYEIKTNE